MKVVVPSKGRSDVIHKNTLALLPSATVVVAKEEEDDYRQITDNILVHPGASEGIVGIGAIRQWILDNVEDEIVVQVDDDIRLAYTQTGIRKRRVVDEESILNIFHQTAIMAKEMGTCVFGYTQNSGRPQAYKPMAPIKLVGWVGAIVGFVGRSVRYDTELRLRADIDFCLKVLLKHRIVCIDERYDFVHVRFAGSGSNAANRSAERTNQEIAKLQNRWGKYLTVTRGRSLNIGIKLARTQG